jgi:hypothetical protein
MAGQVFPGQLLSPPEYFEYAMADWEMPDHPAYLGTACGTEMEEIVCFGASVLWL